MAEWSQGVRFVIRSSELRFIPLPQGGRSAIPNRLSSSTPVSISSKVSHKWLDILSEEAWKQPTGQPLQVFMSVCNISFFHLLSNCTSQSTKYHAVFVLQRTSQTGFLPLTNQLARFPAPIPFRFAYFYHAFPVNKYPRNSLARTYQFGVLDNKSLIRRFVVQYR